MDPLYVANEGRWVAFVAQKDVDKVLEVLRQHEVSQGACVVGNVVAGTAGLVTIKSRIGAARILDLLTGEQLPRIC